MKKKNPSIVKIRRQIIIICIYLLWQGHRVKISWHLTVTELYIRCFLVSLELDVASKSSFSRRCERRIVEAIVLMCVIYRNAAASTLIT